MQGDQGSLGNEMSQTPGAVERTSLRLDYASEKPCGSTAPGLAIFNFSTVGFLLTFIVKLNQNHHVAGKL